MPNKSATSNTYSCHFAANKLIWLWTHTHAHVQNLQLHQCASSLQIFYIYIFIFYMYIHAYKTYKNIITPYICANTHTQVSKTHAIYINMCTIHTIWPPSWASMKSGTAGSLTWPEKKEGLQYPANNIPWYTMLTHKMDISRASSTLSGQTWEKDRRPAQTT